MTDSTEWELYVSASGSAVVEKQIQDSGLTSDEVAELQRMLDRVERGEVFKKDVKYLKSEKLWEARLDGNRRIFRLLFAKRRHNTVLVGLYFTPQKKNKLPQSVFKTARTRLEDWDSRNPQ